MLSCLGLVVTPPAPGVWASRGLLQVLSREEVARLELVEPRSQLLVRLSHGRVRLLLVTIPVFAVACSASGGKFFFFCFIFLHSTYIPRSWQLVAETPSL